MALMQTHLSESRRDHRVDGTMGDLSHAAFRRSHAQMLRRNALSAVCGLPVWTSTAVNRSVDERPQHAVANSRSEAVAASLPCGNWRD